MQDPKAILTGFTTVLKIPIPQNFCFCMRFTIITIMRTWKQFLTNSLKVNKNFAICLICVYLTNYFAAFCHKPDPLIGRMVMRVPFKKACIKITLLFSKN